MLARLVPELVDALPEGPVEPWAVLEGIVDWLAEEAGQRPIVLVLDDLHWAATPTLAALMHLVHSERLGRLLIVGTYRDTELARTHPLAGVLADLRREEGVERLSIRGLDEDGVEAFVHAARGDALDEESRELAGQLSEQTQGNPFFVGQVLRHLAEAGVVKQVDGRWVRAEGADGFEVPEGVREVIGRRVSRLSERAGELLTVAAVAGSEFDTARRRRGRRATHGAGAGRLRRGAARTARAGDRRPRAPALPARARAADAGGGAVDTAAAARAPRTRARHRAARRRGGQRRRRARPSLRRGGGARRRGARRALRRTRGRAGDGPRRARSGRGSLSARARPAPSGRRSRRTSARPALSAAGALLLGGVRPAAGGRRVAEVAGARPRIGRRHDAQQRGGLADALVPVAALPEAADLAALTEALRVEWGVETEGRRRFGLRATWCQTDGAGMRALLLANTATFWAVGLPLGEIDAAVAAGHPVTLAEEACRVAEDSTDPEIASEVRYLRAWSQMGSPDAAAQLQDGERAARLGYNFGGGGWNAGRARAGPARHAG